jgi:hypothetical protein
MVAGIDYADVMKTIIQACRPGTYSIDNFQILETLSDQMAPAPAVYIYAGGATHREDSKITRSSRIPLSVYCRGTSKQNCLNVAQEVTDAIDHFGYYNGLYKTYSTNVLRSANSATVRAAGTAYLRNCDPIEKTDTILPWVQVDAAVTLEATLADKTQVIKVSQVGEGAAEAKYSATFDTTGSLYFYARTTRTDQICLYRFGGVAMGPGCYFGSDGHLYFIGLNLFTGTDAGGYTASTWYKIGFVYNFTAHTYDAYLDDALIGTGLSFYNNTTASPSEFDVSATYDTSDIACYIADLVVMPSTTSTESAYVRFPGNIPNGGNISATTLTLTTANRIYDGIIKTQAAEGNADDFSTLAKIAAETWTTADSNNDFDADSETVTVTILIQEALDDGGEDITQLGFRLQPQNTQACYLDVSTVSLLLQYTFSNQPSHIIKLNDGRPERCGDVANTWEVQLAYNLLYNGVSKNIA